MQEWNLGGYPAGTAAASGSVSGMATSIAGSGGITVDSSR
jgi:hypothetical protein